MKIKYRNETLHPNHSQYCIHCAIHEYTKADKNCFGLCYKINLAKGFNIIDDCKVLEL